MRPEHRLRPHPGSELLLKVDVQRVLNLSGRVSADHSTGIPEAVSGGLMCDQIVGRATRIKQRVAVGRIHPYSRAAIHARERGKAAGAGIEIRVIEKVKEVKTELKGNQLMNLPVLVYGEVGRVEVGTAAVSARSHVRRKSANLIADQGKRIRVNDLRSLAPLCATTNGGIDQRTLRRGEAGL